MCLLSRTPHQGTSNVIDQDALYLSITALLSQLYAQGVVSEDLVAAYLLLSMFKYVQQQPEVALMVIASAIRAFQMNEVKHQSFNSGNFGDGVARRRVAWVLAFCERYGSINTLR